MNRLINIIFKNGWLFLLLLLPVHLLLWGTYINHHENIAQQNQKARRAMEQFIFRGGRSMNFVDFSTLLSAMNSTDVHIGSYRMNFSLVESVPRNVRYRNSKADFYDYLQDGRWLHYTESPAISFFYLPRWFILFELLVIGVIVFYFWWKSWFTISFKNFKLSAERVETDLNTDLLPNYGPSIVRETTDAMHKMQKRIQNLINGRTQLLAAISHDLRTPITRLKLRAQFIQDTEQSEKIIQDLDEMESMITEILSFARNETTLEKKIKFDINALLLSVCYSFIDRGYAININLNQGNVSFFGRCIALKRTFTNLIENAVKYAGQAEVTLVQANDQITILVEDNGPGIPEEELEMVLQPYYRLTDAVSQNQAGVGLGLTIVHEVINSHNGTLILKNRHPSGLQVTVVLSLNQE